MKYKITLFLSSLLVFIFIGTNGLSAADKEPVGKWKFSAPDAPYGYNQGIIEIIKEADEYSARLSFSGMDYKYDLEKVKYEEEKISFSIYLEGENIFVLLTFNDEDNISGKASYSMGEIPLYATRQKDEQ